MIFTNFKNTTIHIIMLNNYVPQGRWALNGVWEDPNSFYLNTIIWPFQCYGGALYWTGTKKWTKFVTTSYLFQSVAQFWFRTFLQINLKNQTRQKSCNFSWFKLAQTILKDEFRNDQLVRTHTASYFSFHLYHVLVVDIFQSLQHLDSFLIIRI